MAGAMKVGELVALLRLDKSQFERDAKGAGGIFDGLAGVAQKAALAVGAAIVGIGAAAVKMAIDEEVGIARMTAAIEANARSWDGNMAAVEEVINQREELAFADSDLRDSLSALVGVTQDVDEAFRLQAIAMDLARYRGMDLGTASELIGKVAAGNTGILSRYGIVLEEGATATEALAEISRRAAGQAEAYANTTAGAWDIFQNELGNVLEDVGALLLPMLTDLAGVAKDVLLPVLQDLASVFVEIAQFVSDLVEGAFAALEQSGADIGAIFNEVVGVLGGAMEMIGAEVGKLIEFLQPLWDLLGEHAQSILIAFAAIVGGVLTLGFLSLAAAVWAALAPFVLIGAAIAGAVIVLEELGLMGPIIDGAMSIIRVGVDLVSQAFAWLSENILPPLVAAFEWFAGVVGQIAEIALPLITGALGLLGDALGWVAGIVMDVLGGAFRFVSEVVLPPVQGALDFLANTVVPILVDAFRGVADFIKGTLGPVFQQVFGAIRDVVDKIFGFLKGLFDGFAQHVLPHLRNAFDLLGKAVGFVFNELILPAARALMTGLAAAFEFIRGILDTLSDAFDAAADLIAGAFSWVMDQIGNVVDGITGFFNDVIRSAQDLANKVAAFLGDMFRPLVEGIQNAVGIAKDIWNGFVRFWNGFEIRIPAIKVGDFQITPELVFGLPDLPRLASGGTAWADMTALVGERGPELVRLPAGARVESAARTRDLLAGGVGSAPLIGTQVINGVAPDEVETQTRRAIRRATLEMRFA